MFLTGGHTLHRVIQVLGSLGIRYWTFCIQVTVQGRHTERSTLLLPGSDTYSHRGSTRKNSRDLW